MTLNTILKQVEKAYPDIESHHYSETTIAKQLRTILKSVEGTSADMRVKVYWAIVDRTLAELNEYGMSDEPLETLAIDTMELLAESLNGDEQSRQERQTIITELMDYYTQGNCGIVDAIYEAVNSMCVEESDYRIVIQKLEDDLTHSSFRSYHESMLAGLYAKIGDTDSQLAVLESGLEYGTDYWRLAAYWLERDEKEKALEIVKEGLDEGTGRKTELYEYMQNHLQAQGDIDGIFQLLKKKIEDQNLDNRGNAEDDSTYQYLSAHYETTHDYQGKVSLLKLRFSQGENSLNLYKAAEKTLNPTDLPKFQQRIIQRLKKAIQESQSKNLWWARNTRPETQMLAEIHAHENDLDNLINVISEDIALLAKYESKLLSHYPDIYVEQYSNTAKRLIEQRGRENYRTAAKHLKAVKHIHQTVLKTPSEWAKYIEDLRQNNKTLRALQEELKGL